MKACVVDKIKWCGNKSLCLRNKMVQQIKVCVYGIEGSVKGGVIALIENKKCVG